MIFITLIKKLWDDKPGRTVNKFWCLKSFDIENLIWSIPNTFKYPNQEDSIWKFKGFFVFLKHVYYKLFFFTLALSHGSWDPWETLENLTQTLKHKMWSPFSLVESYEHSGRQKVHRIWKRRLPKWLRTMLLTHSAKVQPRALTTRSVFQQSWSLKCSVETVGSTAEYTWASGGGASGHLKIVFW